MRTNQAFWDASAIVPLCVEEESSMLARQTLRHYPKPVVWWSTRAEARSALARAVRHGLLAPTYKLPAQQRLERLSRIWVEVVPNLRLRDLAVQLLDDYPLRTGDALQLAAALTWSREKPRRYIFVCFDDRLATVAEEVGFIVIKA